MSYRVLGDVSLPNISSSEVINTSFCEKNRQQAEAEVLNARKLAISLLGPDCHRSAASFLVRNILADRLRNGLLAADSDRLLSARAMALSIIENSPFLIVTKDDEREFVSVQHVHANNYDQFKKLARAEHAPYSMSEDFSDAPAAKDLGLCSVLIHGLPSTINGDTMNYVYDLSTESAAEGIVRDAIQTFSFQIERSKWISELVLVTSAHLLARQNESEEWSIRKIKTLNVGARALSILNQFEHFKLEGDANGAMHTLRAIRANSIDEAKKRSVA